ncbi:DUF6344 domain-containing protein [Streptomyces sp. NPDC002588]|uniref:DUF6344 domain-containing protein n=1 Tax=Streptomyces sp. NPDC002588 TaxID=3154419 RepID=UPI0033272F20
MTENRVMKLWTAIVTAFLALATALGFAASTAAPAAAQTGPAHPGSEATTGERSASAARTTTWPAASPWNRPHARSLPPTMKQRIRAEAHGKSPGCRHRPLPDEEAAEHTDDACESDESPEALEPSIPLQR